ncbi:MAG: hypothetical protein ACYDH3_00175 [Candidatus Aminicenantales bacterium]
MKKMKLYRIEIWAHDKEGDNANVEAFNILAQDAKGALKKAEQDLIPSEYVADIRIIGTVDQA